MRKEREALLVAALAGLVIVGAAAFVVQPSLGSHPKTRLQLSSTSVQSGHAVQSSGLSTFLSGNG